MSALLLIFHFSFFIFHAKANCPPPLVAHAGNNIGVCPKDSVKIGGNPAATGGIPPYTYSWQPASSVNNSTSANPFAYYSTSSTNYTLTVTDASGSSISSVVNVFPYSQPTVNAGPNQTIVEGTNTSLNASGTENYYWAPPQTLYNKNSAHPIAQPGTTTIYCVIGTDIHGCASDSACMTVFVIPSDTIIIYNAFSPNGDGLNDVFYIGNLERFPQNKLEIYNRNGKLVYQASPYNNDWDGRIDGTEIPCATYYYIFYPGNGEANRKGGVTIIR